MKIDFSMKVADAIAENPKLKDILIGMGFEKLKDPVALKTFARMVTLEMVLDVKGISKESFLQRVEDYSAGDIEGEREEVSLDEADLTMEGVLPCPVKDTILEALHTKLDSVEQKVYTDLRSANLGIEFITDKIQGIDDIPDIFLTAGFEFPFFNEHTKSLFTEEHFRTFDFDYNKDFAPYADPKGIFHIAGAVPCVFLIAPTNQRVPTTWKELVSGDFHDVLSIPLSDLDMFNATVLTIKTLYGDEGIDGLQKAYKNNLHPSQMVAMSLKKEEPAYINITPYFFSRMAKKNPGAKVIWPEDGAIMSPIFMAFKKHVPQEIVDYFFSETFAKSMFAAGTFPSSVKTIENNLPGRLNWIGWENIYGQELGKIMEEKEKLFL